MNYESNRRTARTYTYRISVDDRKALRKINVLDSLNEDYWITQLHHSKVPAHGNGRHFGYVFYQSKEHFDYDRNEMVGGTIPGLGNSRYSLEWERCPLESGLEMRNANSGGTKLHGEVHVGFEDPRMPNNVPIDTVVPWTPTELQKMSDGEPVENKTDYSYTEELLGGRFVRRRPDELVGSHGPRAFQEELRWAIEDGIEELREKLHEYVENCDHDHVVTTGREYGDVAYCEDCGHGWDKPEFEYDQENDSLRVVGTVA